MAGRYLLSPRAKSDLEEIWSYTESHWGFDQAERYIRELARHIDSIAAHPKSGRPCPEVRAGYYKYRAGSHFLFYRMTSDDVRGLRDKMFDWFESRTEGTGHRGAGLGLSIVRSFVELHHGSVRIDSRPGQGTTVVCTFPLAAETERDAAE